MTIPVDVGALAFIDEHAIDVDAGPDVVWDAILATARASADGLAKSAFVRLLGCDPTGASGPVAGDAVGETVPGFRIVCADRPQLLVLAGQHRFARYAIVIRLDPTTTGTRCRLESRADFPGVHGKLYRLGVVTSGAHVRAVKRLLGSIRRSSAR